MAEARFSLPFELSAVLVLLYVILTAQVKNIFRQHLIMQVTSAYPAEDVFRPVSVLKSSVLVSHKIIIF